MDLVTESMSYLTDLINFVILNTNTMSNSNEQFKNESGMGPKKKVVAIPEKIMHHSFYNNPVSNHLYITEMGYLQGAADFRTLREHGCPEMVIVLCINGKGFMEVNLEEHLVLPGQFFILYPNERHRYEADSVDPWSFYWLKLGGMDLTNFCRQPALQSCNKPVYVKDMVEVHKLVNSLLITLDNGCTEERLIYANLTLQRVLAILIYGVDECVEENPNLSTRAIKFMKDNIETRYCLAELADEFFKSPSQFSFLFKREMGISPMEYFTLLKMQHAGKLLHNTNLKISEVALNIGYEDPFHFSKLFKSAMNLSPDQYRRMLK